MDLTAQMKDREAKSNAIRLETYRSWMERPVTRMMISMIPAGEHREALETLLQETFNAGFGAGGGEMLGSMLEAIVRDQGKTDR